MINISLDKSKKYLLACSYGPDSMCLFNLLLNGGYDFAVAHVNYGLREEAIQETKDLIDFCKKTNTICHIRYVSTPIKRNIEEKCREIRYSFFHELVEEHNYDSVLIAHNEDDCIETYLLQKKRKGIVKAYGLQDVSMHGNVRILRPLLHFSKFSILKYDDENSVPYAIDSSNLEDCFERNRIRHHIVEKMSNSDREIVLNEIKSKNNVMKAERERILQQNPSLITELLSFTDQQLAYFFTIKARAYNPSIELSLNLIKEFRKVMMSEKPNVVIKIKKGDVFFVKSYEKAYIKQLTADLSFYYEINSPCVFDCKDFYLNFTQSSKNRNVEIDDYPLIIRNASKNDVMIINGHEIKMRRQFINWKMPQELRRRWPLICNKEGKIIYVPKYSKDFSPDSSTNFYVKI